MDIKQLKLSHVKSDTFIEQSKPFIHWMLEWKAALDTISLAELIDGELEFRYRDAE